MNKGEAFAIVLSMTLQEQLGFVLYNCLDRQRQMPRPCKNRKCVLFCRVRGPCRGRCSDSSIQRSVDKGLTDR